MGLPTCFVALPFIFETDRISRSETQLRSAAQRAPPAEPPPLSCRIRGARASFSLGGTHVFQRLRGGRSGETRRTFRRQALFRLRANLGEGLINVAFSETFSNGPPLSLMPNSPSSPRCVNGSTSLKNPRGGIWGATPRMDANLGLELNNDTSGAKLSSGPPSRSATEFTNFALLAT